MAEPDPTIPQITDPTTVADLVRFLQVRGDLGLLNLADIVIPTVSLGSVVEQSIQVRSPAFRSIDVFSAGLLVAPAINTVMADTTGLAVGVYDVRYAVSTTEGGRMTAAWEHRNAANAANLATVPLMLASGTGQFSWQQDFAYEIGQGERLRIINTIAGAGGESWAAFIFARIRS